MKNKKWLNYTLGILLTFVVLAVVAGAGVKVGAMQSASMMRPAFAHNFDGNTRAMHGDQQANGNVPSLQGNSQNNDGAPSMQGNFHDNGGQQQSMQGNSRNKGFGNDRGGSNFRSPFFGLVHMALLGLLGWAGYTYVKKSGWRLTRVAAVESAPVVAPAPVVEETPSVEVEEKKESE